jgi:hypothetical protein
MDGPPASGDNWRMSNGAPDWHYAPPASDAAAPPDPRDAKLRSRAIGFALFALAIALLNTGLWLLAFDAEGDAQGGLMLSYTLLALFQLVFGIVGIIYGVKSIRRERGGVGALITSVLLTLGAPIGWVLGVLTFMFTNLPSLGGLGGAWGRPLRPRSPRDPRGREPRRRLSARGLQRRRRGRVRARVS